MKIKINFKDAIKAIPAVFTIAKEGIGLWRNRNKCCAKCRSWSLDPNPLASDRECTNSQFKARVNVYEDLENLIVYGSERHHKKTIVTHETFCCNNFKRR